MSSCNRPMNLSSIQNILNLNYGTTSEFKRDKIIDVNWGREGIGGDRRRVGG